MNRKSLFATILILCLTPSLTMLIHSSFAIDATLSPPPTPQYILTVPKVNEIVYVINITNVNASWITIDFALPKTWAPDTYIQIENDGIKTAGNVTLAQNYLDRENNRTRIYVKELGLGDFVNINITFYSLKYKLEYSTHDSVAASGYPDEYAIYTQPENYIESNDSMIINKALALVGNHTDPFYVAEKIYNFALSYVTYKSQSGIRGALWAIQNGTGDCTEFGTLFVALMRAVGIPARTVIGHVAKELADGGVANASSLGWVRSPHLWAEFYVEGYGWVPVDPTAGRKNPVKHFGIAWADYLPLIKGPTMDDPTKTLVYVRHPPETRIKYESYLMVTPLSSLPFEDKAIQDFVAANEQSNTARHAASEAYHYSFDISDTYPLLESTFSSLANATKAMDDGNSTVSSDYSLDASSSANQTLNMIFSAVMTEAGVSINNAWKDFRILGALSGDIYLRMAENSRNSGDYKNVVQNAYFAEASADQAPNVLVFLGPVVLCILTIGLMNRRHHKTKSVKKTISNASRSDLSEKTNHH